MKVFEGYLNVELVLLLSYSWICLILCSCGFNNIEFSRDNTSDSTPSVSHSLRLF